MLEKFERIKFGHFPTPIEHLKNVTKYLDIFLRCSIGVGKCPNLILSNFSNIVIYL